MYTTGQCFNKGGKEQHLNWKSHWDSECCVLKAKHKYSETEKNTKLLLVISPPIRQWILNNRLTAQ